MIRRVHIVPAALAAALLVPATALASPPSLVSAGRTSDGRPTASWTLPPGGTSTFIELSTKSATGADGAFLKAALEEFPDPDQTSWTATDPLEPGTYYLHVAASDNDCDGCPPEEWSNVSKIVIPVVPPKSGRYSGPVSSSGKISFRVSTGKKPRIRGLKTTFAVKCRHGRTAKITTSLPGKIRVKKNRFSGQVELKKSPIKGRLKLKLSGRLLGGTRAKGTLTSTIHKSSIGECSTPGGKKTPADWSAARG